jgi:uncharacterized GH25 family protein
MKRFARSVIAGAAIVAMAVGAAHAHRAWILPSSTVVSGDNAWVTVDAASSNNLFFPDHRPMQIDAITVTAPDGKVAKIANATVGQYRTTFDLKLDQKGTYRIANASSGFNATYKEGSETKRWRGTLAEFTAQGIDKKPGVELTIANRRVETFVTAGAPSDKALAATGKGLELVPVTHPNDLYSGEEASFKLMDNGKPAAGLAVTIIAGGDRYREDEGAIKATTGKDGMLKVKFPTAGMYWLNTESQGTANMEGKTLKSTSTYSAVLEVLPG